MILNICQYMPSLFTPRFLYSGKKQFVSRYSWDRLQFIPGIYIHLKQAWDDMKISCCDYCITINLKKPAFQQLLLLVVQYLLDMTFMIIPIIDIHHNQLIVTVFYILINDKIIYPIPNLKCLFSDHMWLDLGSLFTFDFIHGKLRSFHTITWPTSYQRGLLRLSQWIFDSVRDNST